MKGEKNSRPLKIAILLDKFLPSRGGERYFSFLARELARRGHEVHVFATKVEDGRALPYQVHLIPVWNHPRSLRILSFRRNSTRMLRKEHFDIVHGAAESPAVNVLNPHGGVERAYLAREFASIRSPLYLVYKLMKRYLSIRHYLEVGLQAALYRKRSLKKVIAISSMIKSDIVRYYGFPEERIAVVFNCVDIGRFHPHNRAIYRDKKRRELAVADDALVLLFAGNNYRLKGLDTLIRALPFLKGDFPGQEFHLLVVGRGHERPYRRLSRLLGVSASVSFLGSVTGMEHYYAASDIYVHPTFYDSCSLTVLEALASGLPVVTSRFNGASDAIVSEEGGRVIGNPADPRELASAVAFYVDEKRRDRARTVTRSWMEAYKPSRNVEETLAVYYEVVRASSQ
jgi:UDP-glucose:(heptosyl)LPS alpha-1,3-glucosyltransferase